MEDGLSDETYEYLITISRPMTVGEFIEEWMRENPDEWGYFGIHDGKSIFGNPKCEYSRGALINADIPPYVIGIIKSMQTPSAHWIEREDNYYRCSGCGYPFGEADHVYCPMCGRAMEPVIIKAK